MSSRLLREDDVIRALHEQRCLFRSDKDAQRFTVAIEAIPSAEEPMRNVIALVNRESMRMDLSEEILRYLFFDLRHKLWDMAANDLPQGKWIAFKGANPPEFHGKHYCSNCNHALHLGSTGGAYNYCPNCGADMRGENE